MNTTRSVLVAVWLFLLTPYSALAAVTINEIAWMGTANSANDEWIELYNDGAATDVTDWRITDGAGFDITLTDAGTITAGQYAVLERTDDDSAPGTAFYVYTGALPNTGATLRLYDAAGSLVDQVAGGEDWATIGGDNVTKETAQYTSSGWGTAVATPGARNNTPEDSETSASVSEPTYTNFVPRVETNTPASAADTIRVVAPEYAFVHQSIDIHPAKVDAKWTHRGYDFWWNFGDGTTAERRETTHVYTHPGQYVIMLAATGRDDTVYARHEITVLPVTLAITRNRSGEVQLSNTAPYEVDLSEYTVRAGDAELTLPAHTIVLPNSTITLMQLGADDASVVVRDALGVVVAETTAVSPTPPTPVVQPTVATIETPRNTAFTFAPPAAPVAPVSVAPVAIPADVPSNQSATLIDAVSAPQTRSVSDYTTIGYFGFFGVLLLAVVAVYARRLPLASVTNTQ